MNRTAALTLTTVAAFAVAVPELADEQDTLKYLAAESYFHDGNLFRLAPGIDPHAVGLKAGKSDSVRSTQLGLRFDKSWSLQTLHLDATASDNRYSDYAYLNYKGTNYNAAWNWQFTPRLTGTLSAGRQQTLINYADYRNYATRNLSVDENRHFDADWWLHGSWHLIGGVSQQQHHNSSQFIQQDTYRLRTAEGGAKYVAESGSWASLLGRSTRGSYPDLTPNPFALIDNEFRQKELELRTVWLLSAISTLDAQIARMSREHATYAQRNFAGTVGHVNYIWTPSAQLQFTLAVQRSIVSYQDTQWPIYTSSYYIDDGFSFAPVWSVSEKATLRFRYGYNRRNFKGEILPTLYQRRDTPRSAMIGFDWMPIRAVTLSATAQRDHRGSTIPGYEYDDNSLSLSVQLLF